jgi:hypothetical protein
MYANAAKDLSSGRPDYSIWAGEQRVARIDQRHWIGVLVLGHHPITSDLTVGFDVWVANSCFDDAKAKFTLRLAAMVSGVAARGYEVLRVLAERRRSEPDGVDRLDPMLLRMRSLRSTLDHQSEK